jgi:hypothetical protein
MKKIFTIAIAVLAIFVATSDVFANSSDDARKARENAAAGAHYMENGTITPAIFREVEVYVKRNYKGIEINYESSWEAGRYGFEKNVSWSGTRIYICWDGKIRYRGKVLGDWTNLR